jgi:phospholipid/cholesterol/gamma-HCH transport system substrate-binding protein
LPSIKDNLNKTIKDVDSTFTNINKLLSGDNIDNISKSISHLNSTMSNLSQISSVLNRSKSSLIASLENIDSITSNLKNNGANINHIIKNFSDLSDSLKTIKLAALVDEFKVIADKINSGTGNAGKLIYDETFYDKMSNTLNSLNDLLTDIKEHPKRYINISVFGKKDK